jgi:hypothetical protein
MTVRSSDRSSSCLPLASPDRKYRTGAATAREQTGFHSIERASHLGDDARMLGQRAEFVRCWFAEC